MLHRRRRSGPASTSTLAIAPSLAPVQTPVFALVLTSPISSKIARRSSAEGYLEPDQRPRDGAGHNPPAAFEALAHRIFNVAAGGPPRCRSRKHSPYKPDKAFDLLVRGRSRLNARETGMRRIVTGVNPRCGDSSYRSANLWRASCTMQPSSART